MSDVAYSPDGNTLAVASGKVVFTYDAASYQVCIIHVHILGKLEWVGGGGGYDAIFFTRMEATCLFLCVQVDKTLYGHTARILSISWSPDSSSLVTGGIDTNLITWDVTSGEKKELIKSEWTYVML